MNLPVKLPDHYFPFVGFSLLMFANIYALTFQVNTTRRDVTCDTHVATFART